LRVIRFVYSNENLVRRESHHQNCGENKKRACQLEQVQVPAANLKPNYSPHFNTTLFSPFFIFFFFFFLHFFYTFFHFFFFSFHVFFFFFTIFLFFFSFYAFLVFFLLFYFFYAFLVFFVFPLFFSR